MAQGFSLSLCSSKSLGCRLVTKVNDKERTKTTARLVLDLSGRNVIHRGCEKENPESAAAGGRCRGPSRGSSERGGLRETCQREGKTLQKINEQR